MGDIVLTSQEDSALGIVEEGTTNTDHDRLRIELDRCFLVVNGDLNNDVTGGKAPVPDQHEGHQQETANQSLPERGTRVKRADGKIREGVT